MIPGGIVNKLAVQRQSRPLLPELSDLFNGFPTFANLRPLFDSNLIRVEDATKDGIYELRAELPGVDPVEEVEITVRDGQLTIKAERNQTSESNGRSEFSYGSFVRTVSLPAGADEDEIHAIYDRGILTISVPLGEDEPTERHIEIIETVLLDDDDDDDDDDDYEDDHYEADDEDSGDEDSGDEIEAEEADDQSESKEAAVPS
jgi:HSP20 family protein